MIAIDNLSVSAGAFALERISFQVPQGQYAVLMGRTGSGKTTLLEAICGLKRVGHGTIRLLDRDVTHLKAAERGIGYVPQDRALFPAMTVWEHLAFALRIRRWQRPRIEARVAELADLLGLGRLLQRLPARLSGGEAQRLALGRALAFEPRVLLLDEPLSALDDETRQEMCELLRAVQTRTGVTTLHVTHNQAEATQLADRLLVLQAGAVEEAPLARLGNGALARASAAEVGP
jgi:ABC-type sugar transport system ATPase subunit